MECQFVCSIITNTTTRSTFTMENERSKQGLKENEKPKELGQKTNQEQRRFDRIRDLLYLEFSFDGIEYISIYRAIPPQIDRLANMYFDVSGIDVNVWPVWDRLDLVNALWDFCQELGREFPLRIKEQPNRSVVPSDQ